MAEEQSFVVTARKWRPLRFTDVVGQEHVTTTLRNAIRSGRVHHAYLFTGPRGVGKTTCARILARALNCQDPQDAEPCNHCAACTEVLDGRGVDVIEIDGASNNSVDDVRKLRDNVRYAPVAGRYKLYIIDEVHMLSTAAFNALLKTLEEPPAHLIFVFATTEVHKVPATILSRCQRFDFRRMEVVSMVSHLGTIATAEGIEIDEAALVAIARKADGSMRDSQSIFDQVVAFCGNSIRLADVADALHLIDADFFFEISTAARERNVARMFELARQVVTRGYDLQECLVGLLEHYRNLLTVIATGSAELIEGAEATRERYVQESALVGQTDVIRNMAAISQGEAQLRQNPPQPRVRFEFTLVRLASMDSSVDLGELLARLGAGGGAQPVGGVPVAIRVGPLRPRKEPASPKPPAIPQSVDKELKPVGELSRKIRAMPRSVNSLTQREMALKWPDVLSELPEHLAFVRSTVRQGLLGVDFTEVGLLLRPSAEIIAHRLSDKLADLKEHLSKVYAAPVAVQLLAAPENGERRAENRERRAENGERRAENGERGAENGEQRTGGDYVPLPIEETLVRLFHARRAGA